MNLLPLDVWIPILDGDPVAAALYERHYSARKSLKLRRERGTLQFVGPSNRLILSTPCRCALFVWRVQKYRADKQRGVECSIFRNEGAGLSSDLIRAADDIADSRWPGARHFTYVDPVETKARRSRRAEPGECFRRAGWEIVRGDDGEPITTGRGLILLERLAP